MGDYEEEEFVGEGVGLFLGGVRIWGGWFWEGVTYWERCGVRVGGRLCGFCGVVHFVGAFAEG